ncbi:MAG: hypothetical protein ACR2O4_16425 [Hyphomicrobiaceae bacterium]
MRNPGGQDSGGDGTGHDDGQAIAGACAYLADMILEVQQMALKLGAGDVSASLQTAYLQARMHAKTEKPARDD